MAEQGNMVNNGANSALSVEIFRVRRARATACLLCFLAGAYTPAFAGPPALTESKAKDLIQSTTRVQACGEPSFSFQSVQIAPLEKQQQDGRTIQYYPVHAHYAVTCIYGDEQMRAEVDLTAYFYQDSFGAWKTDTPTGDEDQSWDNIHSDVRCRVQSLAHVVLDSKGKITSSTPSKDQGFIGCTVEPKAAE